MQVDTTSWWYCDNILDHDGQIGLLRMDFPRVFILVRSYRDIYPGTFENFKNNVAEVNFFTPSERSTADIDSILIDAWNFLALTEREEENRANEYFDDIELQ